MTIDVGITESQIATAFPITHQLALKDAFAGQGLDALKQKWGVKPAVWAFERVKAQVPTRKQAFAKYQQAQRKANAEFGKALKEAGVQPQHHSVAEYTHVIRTQQELQLNGENPSISKILQAAFPDNLQKAKSIGNSRNSKRIKQAYETDIVRHHAIDIAVHAMHGKNGINCRKSAGTFRQSLAINRLLFTCCDTITKQGARIAVLEMQMQSTKAREALDDIGARSSRDKVLTLYAGGKGKTEISRLLEMPINTVKSHLRRSRENPSRS